MMLVPNFYKVVVCGRCGELVDHSEVELSHVYYDEHSYEAEEKLDNSKLKDGIDEGRISYKARS